MAARKFLCPKCGAPLDLSEAETLAATVVCSECKARVEMPAVLQAARGGHSAPSGSLHSTDAELLDWLERWKEAEQQDRSLSLEQFCRHCPEFLEPLRQRIAFVEQMQGLAGGQSTRLEPAPTELPAHSSKETDSRLHARNISLPGYDIIEEIGRGGMGVVYKARQKGLNRLVAIKMILAGSHAGPSDLARFRTEAEAVARLKHPNIVQIHEIGEHDGLPYFSLEYCAGGSLAKKLKGRLLWPRQAAQLVETLAKAMHAAHQTNIIHRDLKPANILLEPAAERPSKKAPTSDDGWRLADYELKITDFGLAKKLDDTGPTGSGAMMGTPSYMAPEQAAGKIKEVGPATDVYALGAILYEMLVGQPPFKAETPLDTVLQVITAEPIPLRKRQPKTPIDLETICLKCLRKEPGRRYADAESLAQDLGRFLDGRPVKARPVGIAARTWKWVKRKPATLVIVNLVVVLALLLGRMFIVSSDPQPTEKADGNTPVIEPLTVKGHDDWIIGVGFLPNGNLLSCSGNAEPPGLDNTIRLWDKESGKQIRQFVGHLDDVNALSVSPDGSRILSGSYDQTMRLWDVNSGNQLDLFHAHQGSVRSVAFSPDGLKAASGSDDRRIVLWDLKTRRAVYSLTGHSESVRSVAFSPDNRTLASGSEDQTIRLWDTRSRQELLRLAGHHSAVTSLAFSPDGQTLLSGANSPDQSLGLWDMKTGQRLRRFQGHTLHVTCVAFAPDGTTALSGSFDRTVRLWDVATGKELARLQGHEDHVLAVAYSPDGKFVLSGGKDRTLRLWALADLGQGPKAKSGQERAKPLEKPPPTKKESPPETPPPLADPGVLLQSAATYKRQGRFAEAENAYRRAIALLEERAAKAPNNQLLRLAEAHFDLGLFLAEKRPREAEKVYRAGIKQWKKLVQDFPGELRYRIMLGGILNNLAMVRQDAGDLKETRDLVEQAINHQDKVLKVNPDHQTARQFLRNHYHVWAETLVRSSDHAGAEKAARALAILDPDSGQELYLAARFLARCVPLADKDISIVQEKRNELAKRYADRALEILRAAVNKGFDDLRAMKAPDFNALRSRNDYIQLLAGLERESEKRKEASLALVNKARELLMLLAKDDFERAAENFDGALKKMVPAKKLEADWKGLLVQAGPFKESTSVRTEKRGKHHVVYLTGVFARQSVDVEVSFNVDRTISGLWFFPKKSIVDNETLLIYSFGPLMQVGLEAKNRGKITFAPNGQTGNTLVRVDGQEAIFGSSAGEWKPKLEPLVKGADGKERRGHKSIWVYKNIPFTQTVEIVADDKDVPNTCLIAYDWENTDKQKTRNVGIRALVDTFIVDNDGHPFAIPGQKGLITTRADFKGKDVPRIVEAWQRNDAKNPGLVASFTLDVGRGIEAPDRFSITRWSKDINAWEIPVQDIGDDAAVVLYWNERELAPGARRRVGFAYGLGVVPKAKE